MNRTNWALVACASLLATACVSKAEYDGVVQSAEQARAELARRTSECADQRGRLEKRVAELDTGRASMQKQLDDATAVYEQLSKELKRLGEDSQSLLANNGSLKAALDSSRARLDELRRAQMAAEARAALYRELALKLKGMVDAGDLAITLRDGRMVLRLSNDVLFDSGRAELKPAGKRALREVGDVLRTLADRQFQIAGHTDNEPIRLSPYHSNWELSTARALEVVSFLVAQKVPPRALSAAGYGEFDPVDANDTAPGRSHNRRTEITLQPNIDELVAMPNTP
ncbi:MAG TPA: OmpA family protein [Polyangiaceae bacterium]|nr:OmpA family protein [Polyangiaceae bacterium]